MIVDSGWDFLSMAQMRWADTAGTGHRQFVVLGDHHWWFYGTHDLHRDRHAKRDEWVAEVLNLADLDYVRYIAVVVETECSRLDYSENAYPDRLLKQRAAARGIHHMGSYFVDASHWSATGPMKTFSPYLGAEDYPAVEAKNAASYPRPRRTGSQGIVESMHA